MRRRCVLSPYPRPILAGGSPRIRSSPRSSHGCVAGCLGPWITLGPFSRSGLDSAGDPVIALAAGILGGLLVATNRSRILGVILGAVVVAIAVVSGLDVASRGDDQLSPSPGWGSTSSDSRASR